MSNVRFENAIRRLPQPVPPIWFMRQAGRYHRHYQALRAKNSFMDLCKIPELAAEVAMGPIEDFDFDVSILFSDLLFPLEALGMGLDYPDGKGPQLGWHLDTPADLSRLTPMAEALPQLEFQRRAVQLTRARLPESKSLIGFVGGPWTLFSYACQGSHDGTLLASKKRLGTMFAAFCERLVPLLIENIRLQLDAGAEIVMLFDTAAGELSPALFATHIVPQLERLVAAHPGKLGYYSKGTQPAHIAQPFFQNAALAGLGVDHRWPMSTALGLRRSGFAQGNFDQALLHLPSDEFAEALTAFLGPLRRLSPEARAGWVCGLGHGVLPQTPEENVRQFVKIVREMFAVG